MKGKIKKDFNKVAFSIFLHFQESLIHAFFCMLVYYTYTQDETTWLYVESTFIQTLVLKRKILFSHIYIEHTYT